MADKRAYKQYTAGQEVSARVIDLAEHEVSVMVDESVLGVLPVARPVNFAVDPPRHLLPGDVITLVVKRHDHAHRRLVLALGADYEARLRDADTARIASETRRAIMVLAQQRAVALDEDHSLDEDLFYDFESRRVVHGWHSQPILEEDLDNPAEMLYQQIDEIYAGDVEGEDDHDDDHDDSFDEDE